MASYNSTTLVGHAGRDGEMRYLDSGKQVASFSLAVSRKVGGEDQTQWFDVQAWDRLAEIIGNYVKKGAAVMVVGPVEMREYTKKDGSYGASMRVTARNIVLLSRKGEASPDDQSYASSEPAPAPAPAPANAYESMPF